jgi:hypothetical protein
MEVGIGVNCLAEDGTIKHLAPKSGRNQISAIEQLLARLNGREPTVEMGKLLEGTDGKGAFGSLWEGEEITRVYISKNQSTMAEALKDREGLWVIPVGESQRQQEPLPKMSGNIHVIQRRVEGA